MRKNGLFFVAVAVGCISALTAAIHAAEVPTVGLLFNTKDIGSLTYTCSQNREGLLECEFNQTSVRKKAKGEDLAPRLKQARDEFRSGTKMSADECKSYNDMNDIFEGRKKPPKEDSLKLFTEMEKRDGLRIAKVFLEFCRSRTEENFLNIVRAGYERDTRTCKVSSNAYRQKFAFVQDLGSGAGAWVAQGSPEGPCGIVGLSRFELETLKDSKFSFWKYVSRKAITNPQGVIVPGILCKQLDEGEYLYDWRGKEHSLGCDYIEFSPI